MSSLNDNSNVRTHRLKINETCIKTLGIYLCHDKGLCY